MLGATHTLQAEFIHYSGRLANSQNEALSGTRNMTFSLYTTATGGRAVWTEQHSSPHHITIVDGHFTANLGQFTSLDNALFTHDELFLGIALNDGPEFTPRTPFQYIPYVVRAKKAKDVATLGGVSERQLLRRGQTMRTLEAQELTFESLEVRDSLAATHMSVARTLNARAFIGDGSRISSLNASNFTEGVATLAQGGTNETSVAEARFQLGINLNTLTVRDLKATRNIQAATVRTLNEGRMDAVRGLAFQDDIAHTDLSEMDRFRAELAINDLVSLRRGATLTGGITSNHDIVVQNESRVTTSILSASGHVSTNRVIVRNQLITPDIIKVTATGRQQLGDIAFLDTVTTTNIADTAQFLRALNIGQLASINTANRQHIDASSLIGGLHIRALAHLSQLDRRSISLPSLRRGLGLGELATQNQLNASNTNIASVSTALRLQALSRISTLTPQFMNIPNLRRALRLGHVSSLDMIRPQDLDVNELKTELNIGDLAELNQLDPDHIDLPALIRALRLGRLATANTLTPELVDMNELKGATGLALSKLATHNAVSMSDIDLRRLAAADALNLQALSHVAAVDQRHFENLDTFKTHDLGLRNLAFVAAITGNHVNIPSLKRALQLGRLATHNVIDASFIANMDTFKDDLGLGDMSTVNAISLDLLNSRFNISNDLRLGRLATHNALRAEDINFEETDLRVSDLIPLSNPIFQGNMTFDDSDIVIQNDRRQQTQRLHHSGHLQPQQLNSSHLQAQGLSANTLTTPRVSANRLVAASSLILQSQIGRSTLSDTGFTLTIVPPVLGPRYTMMNISPSELFLINKTSTTLINVSTSNSSIKKRDSSGDRLEGLDMGTGSDFAALLRMGTATFNRVLLDARNTDAPLGRLIAGDQQVTIRRNNSQLGSAQTYLGTTSTHNIVLNRLGASFGLNTNGNVALSESVLRTFRRVLNYVDMDNPQLTGTLNIVAAPLRIMNAGVAAASLSSNGFFQARSVDVSTVNAGILVVRHRGALTPLGRLAFLNRVQARDFDASFFTALGLNQFATKTTPSFNGLVQVSGNGAILVKQGGNKNSQLGGGIEGLFVKDFTLGATRERATSINSIFQTRELIADHVVFNQPYRLAMINHTRGRFATDSSANMRTSQNVFVGPRALNPAGYGLTSGNYMVGALSNSGNAVVLASRPGEGLMFFSYKDTIMGRVSHNVRTRDTLIQSRQITLKSGDEMIYLPSLEVSSTANILRNSYISYGMTTNFSYSGINFNGPQINILGPTLITVSQNVIAREFVGDGSGLTRLNGEQLVGVLPVSMGGFGTTNINDVKALLGNTIRVLESEWVTVNVTTNAKYLGGVTQNGVRQLDIHAQSAISRETLMTQVTTFNQAVHLERPSFRYALPLNVTYNMHNTIVQNSGTFERSIPSIRVANSVNANTSRGSQVDEITLANSDSSAFGGTAVAAASFGNLPTFKSISPHPNGVGFFALAGQQAGGSSPRYQCPGSRSFGPCPGEGTNRLNINQSLSQIDTTIKAVYEGDGYAMNVENEGTDSTIHAENLGDGLAFEARTSGLLPAITATSMGDTAIFAMGTVQTSSSRRWKTDITPLKQALDKLLQMNGVSYIRTDKRSKRRKIGFLAEDVGAIFPELVDYEKNGVDAQSLAYRKIAPILVEALREQDMQVDKLTNVASQLKMDQVELKKSTSKLDQDLLELQSFFNP